MKCPHCNEEIPSVSVFVVEEVEYEVTPEEEAVGLHDWRMTRVIDGSEKQMQAECPYCEKSLGTWRDSGRIEVLDQSYWGLDFEEWMQKVMEVLNGIISEPVACA